MQEGKLSDKAVDILLNMQRTNIRTYENEYTHYKKILKRYAILAQSLGLENSLQVCMLFTYLLWNGYFSVTGKNVSSTKNLLSKNGLFAFDIMNGKGVCIHHSAMLRDFLNECGYKSASLSTNFNKNIEVDYIPKIRRRNEKGENNIPLMDCLVMPIQKVMGDHEFNLVYEEGRYYIYDATNILLIEIKNVNKAKLVNGTGAFSLKPNMSYSSNLPRQSRLLLDDFCKTKKFNETYNRAYFLDTFKKLIAYLQKNKNLLNYYYESVIDDIAIVASTVKRETEKKR